MEPSNIQIKTPILVKKGNDKKVINTSNRFFQRKVFTFHSFIQHLRLMAKYRSTMKKLRNENLISERFFERIMLVCTAVNECIYCEWGHIGMAKGVGCSEEEIFSLLDLDFSKVASEEIKGLIFAKEYSSSNGNPSRKLIQETIKYYGIEKTNAIIATILMITMGNLSGNTVSAFLSRLHGKKTFNGSLIFELLAFIPVGFLLHWYYLIDTK